MQSAARTVYLLLVQLAVGALWLGLFAYLAINSPSAARIASEVISDILPGSLEIGALRVRFGFNDSQLCIQTDARRIAVRAPDGSQVFGAKRTEVDLALWPLLVGLRAEALRLALPRMVLDKPLLRIEHDAHGHMTLLLAFGNPDDPPPNKPKPLHLTVNQVQVRDAHYLMDLPAMQLDAQQLWFSSTGLRVQTQPGQPEADVQFALQDVVAARVETALASMRLLPAIPAGSVQVDRIEGDLHRMRLHNLATQMPPLQWMQPGQVPDTTLGRVRLDIVLGKQGSVVHGDRMLLATSCTTPFVGKLLGDQFAAQASFAGALHTDAIDGFWLEGPLLARGKLSGFATESLQTHLLVQTGARGDAAVRVVAKDVDMRAYGGAITSPRIDYTLALGAPLHSVRGIFAFADVRGEGPLLSQAIGLHPLDITSLLASGRLNGALGTAVQVRLDPGQPLQMTVALDADLRLQRDAYLKFIEQALPDVTLQGGMRVTMAATVGMLIGMDDLYLRGDDDAGRRLLKLRADGTFDVAGPNSALSLSLDMPRLEAWLQPLRIPNISGALRFEDGQLAGQWRDPGVVGTLTMEDVLIAGQHARHLKTRMRMNRGTIRFEDLVVQADAADVRADVEIGLFGKDVTVMRPHWPMVVKNAAVAKIDLSRFGGGLAGMGEIRGGSFQLDAKDWAHTIGGQAELVLHDLRAGGEAMDRVSGKIAFSRGIASLVQGKVLLLGAPDDGAHEVLAAGSFNLASKQFSADVTVPLLPFRLLHSLADKPMWGDIGLSAQVRGTAGDFEGEVQLSLRGVGWDKIKLGDAALCLTKAKGGPMVLTASRNFEPFEIRAGSEAHFAGAKLTDIALRLATKGMIDPMALLGMPKIAGISAKLGAEVAVGLDLRPGAALWTVDTVIPAGQAKVNFGSGLQSLSNTSDAHIRVQPELVRIGSTHFSMYRSNFEVCGDLNLPKDAAPMTMAMFVAGTVDFPRFGAMAESIAELDMRVDILSDPAVAADPRSLCLQNAQAGRGRLRLDGPVAAPRISGLLQTQAGRITLRKYPHDIVIEEGGRIQIQSLGSGGSTGTLVARIPDDHQLAMHIENGKLKLSGLMRMRDLKLDSMDIDVIGTDLPVDVPKQYSLRISPDVHLMARHYWDDDRRDWKVSGRAVVTEGNYYQNFDKYSGLFGNASDRKVDTYSTKLTDSMPQLADLKLDLAVSGTNFEVNSRFIGCKLDVGAEFNVRVTGTLVDMGMYDHVAVLPGGGSQLTVPAYGLIFEFERGTLDFSGNYRKPAVDVVLRNDVAVRSGSQGTASTATLGADVLNDGGQSDEVVHVYVKISGVFAEGSKNLDFRLTSNKGDTEKDCQCLLLTRRRCNDAGNAMPRITTDIIFGEAINTLATSLLKTFVDTVAINFDAANLGVSAELTKKFGKSITLGTRVMTGRDNLYNANFAFRITERLSLNGLWRRQRLTNAASSGVDTFEVFESKLRYKVPLED